MQLIIDICWIKIRRWNDIIRLWYTIRINVTFDIKNMIILLKISLLLFFIFPIVNLFDSSYKSHQIIFQQNHKACTC